MLPWRPNQPVPVGEPVDLVRDGAPPDGAREAIHALVMRLRRPLDPQAAVQIVTRPPGYAIEVASDGLDAGRFDWQMPLPRCCGINGSRSWNTSTSRS